ncbi:hypothetical protein [Streptomyces scabiei]|uniref:hypothetical protein n=1 Tax=Streptomyces scabiei TaxID=1930 RepID=UPI001B33A967|nr:MULTISPECIES: hypothetical protein [Streptomyces]MBP5896317.1 hypothetical protein [Streptomyces sp. LBUM 1481]MDX3298667.1 hypothetical protein [Streptomyces scabiei]
MRLYSRTGVTALDDPEFGTFHANEDGGFDFPDEVSDRLHAFHLHGQPMWETDVERQRRLVTEELERRKDPATLLNAVEQLVRAAQATTALTPVQPAVPVVPIPPPPPPPAPTPAAAPDLDDPSPDTVAAPPAPAKRASKRTSTKPAE